MATQELTTADFEQMCRSDEWGGFGYLGERQTMPDEAREIADAATLNAANSRELTHSQLFAWANSRVGRWYADSFRGRLTLTTEARRYLP